MEEDRLDKILVQKFGFDTKEFVLEDQTVLVKTKTPREELEYRIRYDELGFELVWKRVKSSWMGLVFLFLLDLLFVGLFVTSLVSKAGFFQQLYWCLGMVFFVVLSMWFYVKRVTDYLYVMGGVKNLELWANKPGVLQVTGFVEGLHEAMRAFYRDKFNKLEDNTSLEEIMTQLKWLLEIKAITMEEYEAYLEGRKSETVIGFKRG